jgi:hypothetical protein
MIAEVTPGWATANAIAMCTIDRPAFSASGTSSSTASSLRSSVKRPGVRCARCVPASWPLRIFPVSMPIASGLQTSVPMP